MERGSGVLLHISSLPSPYGIGTLGRSAYEFVDFLKRSKQKYWQILPLSPTGYGDSPYQSYSAYAGNPYFIDLDMLSENGNLDPKEYQNIDWGNDKEYVDYGKLFENRFKVLKNAYRADINHIREDLNDFRRRESYWIENYAMFMALKYENDLKPYLKWDKALKMREPDAMTEAYNRNYEEIEFWVYTQYRFFEQWNKLKTYANKNGIKIIGDIPIYVAEDSADAWAHNEILQLDENRIPINVAGCPPDYFSPKGQLWGNPVYRWDFLKGTGYKWWIERITAMLKMYDIVRIDHFRAFSDYFSIPFGSKDATTGRWIEGPGKDFFDALKSELSKNTDLDLNKSSLSTDINTGLNDSELPIIAEDLGLIDQNVRDLLEYTGFPGMKVLQFAFSPDGSSDYLPHKYNKNCVAYIGTHDNSTLMGWFSECDKDEAEFAKRYMRLANLPDTEICKGAIKTLMASVADVSIVTMQDILSVDNRGRMNVPSSDQGNWRWRLTLNWVFFDETADWLKEITETYGR